MPKQKADKEQEVTAQANPVGRPTTYTPELTDKICALLAEGKSVRYIADLDDMPASSTIFQWLRKIPEFTEQYEKAKEESADALVSEMLDIASEMPMIYEPVGENGAMVATKLDSAGIARNRLRVDVIKWQASKLKAKKYGDKAVLEHTGKDGDAILVDHVNVAMEELFETIKKKL
jgi:hypothetical protein